MDDIPSGDAGSQKIKLTYEINLNGVLKVTAISKSNTGNVKELIVKKVDEAPDEST